MDDKIGGVAGNLQGDNHSPFNSGIEGKGFHQTDMTH
jgi:hypothetical protein